MTVTSPAFEKGGTMPERFSRDGADRSPPLVIRDVPRDAAAIALIMDDPDAPGGTFTHWIAFNLDPIDQQIPEAAALPDAVHGLNGWNEARYGGPRPPSGEHRYVFRVFALDQPLPLASGTSRGTVEREMRNHVLDEASIMARFSAPSG